MDGKMCLMEINKLINSFLLRNQRENVLSERKLIVSRIRAENMFNEK